MERGEKKKKGSKETGEGGRANEKDKKGEKDIWRM